MKVAVITQFISPYKGSERSVAWNFVKEMSKAHELVVFYANDVEDIENYAEIKAMQSVEFVHVPLKEQKASSFVFKMLYQDKNHSRWHSDVFNLISQNYSSKVDLVHYVGPIGIRQPGIYYKLDLPVIWGPVSTLHLWPFFYLWPLNFGVIKTMFLRYAMLKYTLLFNKKLREAIKGTDFIYSATPETQELIRRVYGRESYLLPENGIEKIETNKAIICNGKLEIFVNGGGDIRKGLHLLIDAVAKLDNRNFVVNVVGALNEQILSSQKRQVKINKLDDNFVFWGNIERNKVQDLIRNSHLNIILSASEATTTIIWECMAKGVPTLSLDHCGMAHVLNDKCGIKIKINGRKKIISDITSSISFLLQNPERIEKYSVETLVRAENFLWIKRRDEFSKKYKSVCGDFTPPK